MLFSVGFLATFLVQHWLGNEGMLRGRSCWARPRSRSSVARAERDLREHRRGRVTRDQLDRLADEVHGRARAQR